MDEQLKNKIKALLEYQKKDIEVRKLNSVIDRDAALADMNKHKRAFNDAKRIIGECEQQADRLVEQYEELKRYVDENEAVLASLDGAEEIDEEELDKLVKKLESIKSKFQNADKRIHEIEERSRAVFKSRTDALKTGSSAKTAFAAAKDKHSALVNSKAGEVAALRASLDAMPAKLDKELFEEYKKLCGDNKFPPVVPAVVLDERKNLFNCGGCGLGLPQQCNTQLNEQGLTRCDNCHRIIYHIK